MRRRAWRDGLENVALGFVPLVPPTGSKRIEMRSETTQTQQVTAYLRRFGKIDPLTALREFRCLRLASRILEIRKAGLDVKTTIRKAKGGARYAVYSLAAGSVRSLRNL
jgi:hypothetical protein